MTTDPDDVQRVKHVLARLKLSLDGRGCVTDPALRQRIVEAHQDVDWSPDARVMVDLGPPAASEQLQALQALWDERFATELPADYRAFLEQHDGMAVRQAGPQDDAELPAGYLTDPMTFMGYSMMTCRAAREWLETTVYEETHPDGTRVTKDPRFAPFFEIDSDWFGFDFKAGATNQPPIALADGEVLWKPTLEPVATCFAAWLERLADRGFESIGLLLPDERAQSESPKPPPVSEPPSRTLPRRDVTLLVPLVLTRPKLGVLVGALLSGGFLVLSVAMQRMSLQALLALAVFGYCVWRLKSSRYSIEIDERGVYDGALGRPRLAWSSVADVSFEGNEAGGRLVLKLTGPPSEDLRIVLDGLQTPPAAVLSSAIAYWHAAQP